MSRNLSLMLFVVAVTIVIGITSCEKNEKNTSAAAVIKPAKPRWIVPDTSEITNGDEAKLIKYGRLLIVNTSYYFGPKGVIAHKSNGLNCQNCHLNAGTRLDGNNFSLTAVGYPRFEAAPWKRS
jgi:thiosulfate dehydrogenase